MSQWPLTLELFQEREFKHAKQGKFWPNVYYMCYAPPPIKASMSKSCIVVLLKHEELQFKPWHDKQQHIRHSTPPPTTFVMKLIAMGVVI